jgi:UMP-CMP kinase family protein
MGCGASKKSTEMADNHRGGEPLHKKKKKEKLKGKVTVIFVLGGPGSGKGTQCDQIKKDYAMVHLSVGDLLRDEKATGSKYAQEIEECISQGKLVPAKVPVKLLKKAMKKRGWNQNQYLIDGFPRNQENLDVFLEVFGNLADIKFVLFYECSQEAMEKRILERGKTSGRSDDNPESLKKRFATYINETKPVVDFYEGKGLIRKINAERTVAEVYGDTKKVLDEVKPIFTNIGKKCEAVFVIGGPGSGKGTQCERIIKDYGFKHLSVGDLLREEKKSGSALAKELESYMSQGKLVPSEVPVKILRKAFEKETPGTVFLIDGFPRNKENTTEWDKIVGDFIHVKAMLYFECTFETMEKRLLERAKTSGRSDDNPDAIKVRIKTYESETAPVIEEFQKKKLVHKISAEHEVDKVYDSTKTILNKLFHK